MDVRRRSAVDWTVAIIVCAVLAVAFYQRATYNLRHIDYRNSNFVFFWMAGRMVLAGENPYDSAEWLAEHDANNVAWRPNLIFPYPLPLAVILAPLGMVSLQTAYVLWQFLSGVLLALAVWSLLQRSPATSHWWLLLPLVVLLLFFGPVFLTLQIGALGGFMLAAVVAALHGLEHQRLLSAGMLLSLTLLKPPVGVPLLALLGIWLIALRRWKVIAGMGLGALGMLALGMILDPLWLAKFTSAGQKVLDRTLGFQSNLLSLAYHACGSRVGCMWLLGGIATIGLLFLVSAYLWRRRSNLGAWEALSLAIPTAFVSTLYLWSYDQILYVVPIVWLFVQLRLKSRSYVLPFAFIVLLVVVSFLGLVVQARTRSDLTSFLTTALVLGGAATFLHRSAAPDRPASAPQ